MNTALADPNDTRPHTDVIKEKLLDTRNDTNVSEELRDQARTMLAMFYPETPTADPNRWQGQGNIVGGAISNGAKVKPA
jgi:hypothetical protein